MLRLPKDVELSVASGAVLRIPYIGTLALAESQGSSSSNTCKAPEEAEIKVVFECDNPMTPASDVEGRIMPRSTVAKCAAKLMRFSRCDDLPSEADAMQTCFQVALSSDPTHGSWGRYLGDLLRMPIVTSPSGRCERNVPSPPWRNDMGSFGGFWDLAWFRCLFFAEVGMAHLSADRPEEFQVSLENQRGEMRPQSFFKFRIVGAERLPEPSNWTLKGFDKDVVTINCYAPVGFTHGLNFSQLLPILMDGSRLAKSARTKDGLSGAWVAKEGDFRTCDRYAGPELLSRRNDCWIQVFLIGQTWDLKSPKKHPTYRCIRTKEGHVCTHALLRVWPNDERESLKLSEYHFRPPGGLGEDATERFHFKMQAALKRTEQRECVRSRSRSPGLE